MRVLQCRAAANLSAPWRWDSCRHKSRNAYFPPARVKDAAHVAYLEIAQAYALSASLVGIRARTTNTMETELSLIIPAFNEAQRLPRYLRAVRQHLSARYANGY